MRILFMGTPELAKACLERVFEYTKSSGDTIVGAVTQTDKPKGRGMSMVAPPVKIFAEESGIPVFQPKTLRDGAFESELKSLDPDMIIVVAYGKILPSYVLDYPKYGSICAHGSILPKYRGAAPIQRAIIDGERVTGITAMWMNEGIDTGDIIKIYPCEISETDDFGTLHDKLAIIAGDAMVDVIEMTKRGGVTRTKQDDSLSCYAEKIEKEDAILDFSRTSAEICNRIRGLSPMPYAMTKTPDGKLLKLTDARIVDALPESSENSCFGEVISLDSKGEGKIVIKTSDGAISVSGVIPEGKKKMSAGDFIRGRRINIGDILAY